MGTKDLRIVLRDVGLLAPVVGVMAVCSVPVAVLFDEWHALGALGWTVVASLGVWAFLYLPFRRAGEARLKHGLIVAAVGWLVVAALGALPLSLVSTGAREAGLPYADPTSAFFESISGFTGTGLTMALRPDLLPRTLQWWRSFMEWVGGMGVIVLMITLIVGPGMTAANLYFAEARGEKIHPSVLSTVRTMWWIYLLYTFLAVAALWGAGMPLWDAVNHGMTGVATGGFSIWPESLGHYRSLGIEIVTLFVMIAGAISFVVHYHTLQRGPRTLVADVQTRALLILVVVGGALLSALRLGVVSADAAFRGGAFQFASALTCTGFQTVPLDGWSDVAKLMLIVGMVIGGAAGSTAGGIKVMRFMLLVRGASWQLKRLARSPDAVIPLRWGRQPLPEVVAFRRMGEAAVLAMLWLFFLLAGALLLSRFVSPDVRLADLLFEVASAQGNVGLSVGITAPGMSGAAKLVLCFNMWVGRLEIIPVLMLIRGLTFQRD
ncbi:MAG: Trk potassium uptake system protein TrkH [Candidatus Bipolaricaulis sibiricus]|uniref:Trk potassium uptake system protein TrkH n=1 Tax=Bipolaricaulis sibiricus TaxID=2501609 RepID=A0A410FTM8_BIPS1|nr:MAG: Trk potassium uptake system protein TrkH [Candidatus Bipolaricaulis sibiricus]